MKRQAEDLINEMAGESEKFTRISIVVGCESTTQFVWNHDEKKLEILERLMEEGGEPIGLAAYIVADTVETKKALLVYGRTFTEYASEGWATDYLDSILGHFRQLLQRYEPQVNQFKVEPEWIN